MMFIFSSWYFLWRYLIEASNHIEIINRIVINIFKKPDLNEINTYILVHSHYSIEFRRNIWRNEIHDELCSVNKTSIVFALT